MNAPKLRHERPSEAQKAAKRAAKHMKPLGTGMMLPGLVAERERMLASRTSVASAKPLPGAKYAKYTGEGQDASDHRTGANDFLEVPSRFNGVLSYRDGRVLPFPSTNPKA